MRLAAVLLFSMIFSTTAFLTYRSHVQSVRVPVKSTLKRYRTPARMPANTLEEQEQIRIGGRNYVIRKDLTVSDEKDPSALKTFGSKYVVSRPFGKNFTTSQVQVLQSSKGRLALLYPKIKIKTDDFVTTRDWLIDLDFEILFEAEPIGVFVVKARSSNMSSELERILEQPSVVRAEPSIVEDRAVPR